MSVPMIAVAPATVVDKESRPERKKRVPRYITDPVKYESLGIAVRDHKKAGSAIELCHVIHPLKAETLKTDFALWNRHAEAISRRHLNMAIPTNRSPLRKERLFRDLWSYQSIRPIFKRATCYRAGFVVLRCEPDQPETCQVLIVHQRQPTIITNQKGVTEAIIPPKMGFPKGTAEPCDRSAWDTANRELREEIGSSAYAMTAFDCECVHSLPFVFVRKIKDIVEVHVYFVAECPFPLSIDIDTDELLKYTWFNWTDDFDGMPELSAPASAVLKHMHAVYPDMAEEVAVSVGRTRKAWSARFAEMDAASGSSSSQ